MNEIEWLAARRPDPEGPSEAATAHARTALVEHTELREEHRLPASFDDDRRVPAARDGRRPAAGGIPARRRRGARVRVLAAASVAAVAAVVAISALPSGDGHSRLAPPAAEASPLVRLSTRLQDAPAPPGDATLVLRTHHFPSSPSFTGADLYEDGGLYFYGRTLSELRDAAKASDDTGYQATKHELEAARAALSLAPGVARQRMIDATLAPGPNVTSQPAAGSLASKQLLAKRRAEPSVTASPETGDDNRVWIGCMDALTAGAGRADVRAGVMKLLSAMPSVKVEQGDGVLRLRMTGFPDGYEETLVVDDATGVLRQQLGGKAGKTPDVVVDYDVKRVDAKDVLAG